MAGEYVYSYSSRGLCTCNTLYMGVITDISFLYSTTYSVCVCVCVCVPQPRGYTASRSVEAPPPPPPPRSLALHSSHSSGA